MLDVEQAVNLDTGLVDSHIFADDDIYQKELSRVFGKTWQFVGHTSSIPNTGDYVSSYLGDDSVIVNRDVNGKIRVLLNKCRHRGNKVCLFDRGNARAFTCTYHGWAYNSEGKLSGVPFLEEFYLNELKKEDWGLVEVPRVEIFGGLIFACWDPDAVSLEAYLGDMAWYLDHFMTVEYLGGLEVVPGIQRYMMPGNWKLCADNFAGDHYHFSATHASYLKVFREYAQSGEKAKGLRGRREGPNYEVTIGYKTMPPHAIGQIRMGTEVYEDDLRRAAELGPEAVDWVRYRFEKLQDKLKNHQGAKPYCFTRGHSFPNFSQIGLGSALEGRGLILWIPRGPHHTEAWEWCAVEKEAPRIVKENAISDLLHGQSAAGLIAPDDHENFERMLDNMQGHMMKRWPFNYQMSLGRDESYPGRENWEIDGLPGLIGYHSSEVNQRQFYRYWQHLMREDDNAHGKHGDAAGDRAVSLPGGATPR
jgi:phenylpropionate dioxygenase-like ring-hydroxylating dioxygenase large terminal subunit